MYVCVSVCVCVYVCVCVCARACGGEIHQKLSKITEYSSDKNTIENYYVKIPTYRYKGTCQDSGQVTSRSSLVRDELTREYHTCTETDIIFTCVNYFTKTTMKINDNYTLVNNAKICTHIVLLLMD